MPSATKKNQTPTQKCGVCFSQSQHNPSVNTWGHSYIHLYIQAKTTFLLPQSWYHLLSTAPEK